MGRCQESLTGHEWGSLRWPPGLGRPFSLNGVGSADGDGCGSAVPPSVNMSGALLAQGEQSGQQGYELQTSGSITGGFGRKFKLTAEGAKCVVIPSALVADVSFETFVRIVVRSNTASSLRLQDNGAQPIRVMVVDWKGERRAGAAEVGPLESRPLRQSKFL